MSEGARYGCSGFPHGLMFHHFVGGKHGPGQGAIDAATFARCLDHVGQERILSAEEWVWRTRHGRLRPGDLCLTFDDGLACQFEIALPVLRERSLTAFWFIYSAPLHGERCMLEVWRLFRHSFFETVDDFYDQFFQTLAAMGWAERVERGLRTYDHAPDKAAHPYYSVTDLRFRFARDSLLTEDEYRCVMERMMAERKADVEKLSQGLWMSASQIASLAEMGHEIGLHSHSHSTVLGRMTREEQHCEYQRNHETLTSIVGRAPVSVAHPCNSYNESTLEILAAMGIAVGFRANLQAVGGGVLEFPRQDHANLVRAMEEPA